MNKPPVDHHCSSRDISACCPGRLYYRAARLSLIGTAGLDLFCRSFNPACGTPVTIDVSVVRAPVTVCLHVTGHLLPPQKSPPWTSAPGLG